MKQVAHIRMTPTNKWFSSVLYLDICIYIHTYTYIQLYLRAYGRDPYEEGFLYLRATDSTPLIVSVPGCNARHGETPRFQCQKWVEGSPENRMG